MPVASKYATDEYILGGGFVQIAPWDGETPPEEADWYDLGAVPDVTATVTSEVAEHFVYFIGGMKMKDKQQATMVGLNLKFTADQINQDTLTLFFMGEKDGTDAVNLLLAPLQEFAIRVLPEWSSTEKRWQTYLRRGTIKPDGDFDMFPKDKYGAVSFQFDALIDYANNPTNPWGTATLATP